MSGWSARAHGARSSSTARSASIASSRRAARRIASPLGPRSSLAARELFRRSNASSAAGPAEPRATSAASCAG